MIILKMKMTYLLVSLLVIVLVHQATSTQTHEELCEQVSVINCKANYKQQSDEALCGSNGETYINRCFFVQAKCQDASISIVCRGNCTDCNNVKGFETTSDETSTNSDSLSKTSGNFGTTDPMIYHSLNTNIKQSSIQTNDHPTTDNMNIQHKTLEGNLGDKSSTMSELDVRMQPTSTTSLSEEKFHNMAGVTITRTRKNLPGHHADEMTDTTNVPIPPAGKVCPNGNCFPLTTPQTQINLTVINLTNIRNCSSDECIQTLVTAPTTDSILLTVLTRSTYKIEKVTSTQSTILKVLTRTSSPPEMTTTRNVMSSAIPTTVKPEVITSSKTYITTIRNIIGSVTPTEEDFLLFCKNVDDKQCPTTLDPLCGTDNTFYLNICTFNKAKCKNRNLDLQLDLGICRRRSRS